MFVRENTYPRCSATVKLLSKYFRPYLFEVVVVGEPPHAYRVRYKITAPDDDSAALKGMQLFCHEFVPWIIRKQLADVAPKAILQG